MARDNLKILIISTPKTGNVWVKSLLHHAYSDLPYVELPVEFSRDDLASLPSSYIAHQHYFPNLELLEFLVSEKIHVLSTVRHPGDTFLSLYDYSKIESCVTDEDELLAKSHIDGDDPGLLSLEYLDRVFSRTYAITLAWVESGFSSQVIRYEDLTVNPLDCLRRVTNAIEPVTEAQLKLAVVLSSPRYIVNSGVAAPSHFKQMRAGEWKARLSSAVLEYFRQNSFFQDVCHRFNYSFDLDQIEREQFDYDVIDPFKGETKFANGVPFSQMLKDVFFSVYREAKIPWDGALGTGHNTFFEWLTTPYESALLNSDFPAETLTNFMWHVYKNRPDIIERFEDPVNKDRIEFVEWFVGRLPLEFDVSWSIIRPIQFAYCKFLAREFKFELPKLALATDTES